MLRALIFISLVLAPAITTADRQAHSNSFALTRLTDNTWDEMPALVDRILVLDAATRPNAVFAGRTPGGNPAIYQAWRPDSWVVQPIVEDPYGLGSAVVAWAPSGAVHAAYCRWTETGTSMDHVRIVEGVPGTAEPICPQDPSLDHPSVAVDPDGVVHVAYCYSDSICYVRREEGGWSPPERLAEGRFASLAIAPDGECHVVYQWWDPQWMSTVRYLHGASGAWSPSEHLAGADGLHARYPTIAVDGLGDVHVAYQQSVPDDRLIDYRARHAGVWSPPEHVASGEMPAIAVDAGGHPCVAFWAGWPLSGIALGVRNVMVASPAVLTGWFTLPVDPEARFGFEMPLRPGLALGEGNDAHVAYDSRDPRGGSDVEMWYATGIVTTDVSDAGGVSVGVLRCWPNPARRALTVRWALGTPGWARVAVSDVSGRHVRTLREGFLAEGEHVATWDGFDSRGRPVPAGVYWVRASAPGWEAIRRVVLLDM